MMVDIAENFAEAMFFISRKRRGLAWEMGEALTHLNSAILVCAHQSLSGIMRDAPDISNVFKHAIPLRDRNKSA
jgi:hypothetical protein